MCGQSKLLFQTKRNRERQKTRPQNSASDNLELKTASPYFKSTGIGCFLPADSEVKDLEKADKNILPEREQRRLEKNLHHFQLRYGSCIGREACLGSAAREKIVTVAGKSMMGVCEDHLVRIL
jgi:hypothetical protein